MLYRVEISCSLRWRWISSVSIGVKWRTLNIDLHYLPPYSQNLNLMERFWKVMNEHVRRNVTFPKVVGSLASLLIIFRF